MNECSTVLPITEGIAVPYIGIGQSNLIKSHPAGGGAGNCCGRKGSIAGHAGDRQTCASRTWSLHSSRCRAPKSPSKQICTRSAGVMEAPLIICIALIEQELSHRTRGPLLL